MAVRRQDAGCAQGTAEWAAHSCGSILTCARRRARPAQHELHPRLRLKLRQRRLIGIAEQHGVGGGRRCRAGAASLVGARAGTVSREGPRRPANGAGRKILQGPDTVHHLRHLLLHTTGE